MNNVCRICGSTNTEIISKIENFEYKGQEIEIPDYLQVYCRNCGESVPDPESVKKSVPILRDAQRTIDGLLTGNEIKAIRKSLNMTQEELSEILGGGEKAFARYETGKVAQSKPMDNLLRILKEIPDAIDVLRPTEKDGGCFAEAKLRYTPYINEKPFGYIVHENMYRKLSA